MKKVLGIALIGLLGGAAAAHAQGGLEVRLPMTDGRDRIIQGTREEIAATAEKFSEMGDYEQAKICYLRLIETDPGDVRSTLLLGQLYQYKLEKYADAIRLYKRAERLVPDSDSGKKAFVWRLSAEAYRELAEKTNSLIYFVQAISEYEKILDRHDPDDIEVMYNLGTCRLNSRDYAEAIRLFKRIAEKRMGGPRP